MPVEQFIQLHEHLSKFSSNLKKEPRQRRESLDRVHKLLLELGQLETKFHKLRDEYNKGPSNNPDETKIIKEHVRAIEKHFVKSREILLVRLQAGVDSNSVTSENQESKEISEVSLGVVRTETKISTNMGEKFDLRTAASLLPSLDGTEDVAKQLIDAIELYAELLDNNSGKDLLIKYVLKAKLNQNAKLRLGKTYNSVDDLVKDMKVHLLTKKSAAVMATQLHSAKQNSKSIEDYAKTIEQLLLDLTLSQAEDNDDAIPILQAVNEKLAITAFSSGLRNSELRTLVKARNFSKLKDAINCAREEELMRSDNSPHSSNLFHSRAYRPNFNRGNSYNYRRNAGSNNFNNRANFQRHTRNYNNHSVRYQGQGRGRGWNSQRRPVNRGNSNSTRRAYFAENAESSNDTNTHEIAESSTDRFFRAIQ